MNCQRDRSTTCLHRLFRSEWVVFQRTLRSIGRCFSIDCRSIVPIPPSALHIVVINVQCRAVLKKLYAPNNGRQARMHGEVRDISPNQRNDRDLGKGLRQPPQSDSRLGLCTAQVSSLQAGQSWQALHEQGRCSPAQPRCRAERLAPSASPPHAPLRAPQQRR
jgi:hypothetical protein